MSGMVALQQSLVSVTLMAAVVTLATLGAVYLTVRGAALLMRSRVAPGPGSLFAQGVAPTILAAIGACGLVLPAFLRFEPPHEGERAGVLLLALAGIGVWHVARTIVRAARMLIISRTFTRRWMASATALDQTQWGFPAYAIDAGFPVVAVAGLFRPRLFVDHRVLAACSEQELDAIAAHERAHVVHRDNLRRLLIGACEGPASVRAAAWREAAERAADAHAADTARRAVDLASALLKMVRLAPARTLECTALSTIHDGGSLEARVRRLLAVEQPAVQRQLTTTVLLVMVPAALVIALNWTTLLRSAHAVTEAAVRSLP